MNIVKINEREVKDPRFGTILSFNEYAYFTRLMPPFTRILELQYMPQYRQYWALVEYDFAFWMHRVSPAGDCVGADFDIGDEDNHDGEEM